MSVKHVLIGSMTALGLAGFSVLPAAPIQARSLFAQSAAATSNGPSNATMWAGGDADEMLDAKWPSGIPTPPSGRSAKTAGAAAGAETVGWVGGGGAIGVHFLRAAYERAATAAPAGCHMTPAVLAGIGQVESGNLAGRTIGDDHVVRPGVFGPDLTGGPYANISDSDGGRWDGVAGWDRAVGPMQFIPSTWAGWGSDGDGDGIADPQNVFDSALSAARYLCAGGRNLATAAGMDAALWSYNRSTEYGRVVKLWIQWYTTNGLNVLGGVAGPGGTSMMESASVSASPSASVSVSASASVSASLSPSASSTPSVSSSKAPSAAPSGTASSPKASGGPSVSVHPSTSPSSLPTLTQAPQPSADPAGPSVDPSTSASLTQTP